MKHKYRKQSEISVGEIEMAARKLLNGSLVAFPTETVYGLGANASDEFSVSRIYQVKGRPADHPLIIHIADLKFLEQWISEIPEYAMALAREFWPGPMTLILKRSALAKNFVTGGQNTVGIRIPNNAIALDLLKVFHNLGGAGVAAPSANRFGHVSPTDASAVREELGKFLAETDLILDGGQSHVGLESTIIDCTGDIPIILRPGAVTSYMINEIIGPRFSMFLDQHPDQFNDRVIRVSGSLENHYAPKAKVILDLEPTAGSGFIALKDFETPAGAIRLSSPDSLDDFARNLYAALREGDRLQLEAIYVYQPIGSGLGEAIRDRLSRSSRGR
jgi:L-threonylcarbamoyladenylate synthase